MDVNLSAMNKYYAGIRGVGYYVPEKVVTNTDLAKVLDTSDEWISSKIGVRERRIAAKEEALSDLAYEAGKRALENAGIGPEEVDLIILSRLDPDHIDPATACLVQHRLGAVNASAFDMIIGGCPGGVYALTVGANFVVSGSCKNVLVIIGDVLSRNMINWRDRNTCCFFGDGVGAAVISRLKEDKGIQTYLLETDGDAYETCIIPAGCSRMPLTTENINTDLRYLHMNNKAVKNFATTVAPRSIQKVTERAGVSVEELDFVIFHQANKNIIQYSMEKLGLPLERTHTTIERYGNTGGASVLITLCDAIEKGLIAPGDKIAMTAFGAGLAWAGMYLQWNEKSDFFEVKR
ncbi:3-oxoacyl-[acyl-carrier-protein] synthase-3 [Anaerovirgula multivorans]|uniref:3-oxoacyl-[acyl-carrier-protein] synthase-3 n=1 Tax=Anaerovirgula multivorans TaxID=312168 RepID=A0A239J8V6_9FIRM|nr:ketoacyl-ACP synthase III [Anaerovirgula multivorans]SNT01084.1 3-oxoacyl-[acyl-carrier-protein] synthase-3 [Anaerovirgula multivorans]